MPEQALQVVTDTAANLASANPTPFANRFYLESDTGRTKKGDGVTAYTSLPYLGGGGVTIQKKTTETRTANTALTADTDLTFTMAANTNYFIRIAVWFDTTAAGDFKFSLSGPASPTLVRLSRRHVDPNALTTLIFASEVAYTSSTAVAGGTGTTGGWIEMEINVQNGANAGAFAFNWAQNTSDAGNTSVLLGSYLSYRIVS